MSNHIYNRIIYQFQKNKLYLDQNLNLKKKNIRNLVKIGRAQINH